MRWSGIEWVRNGEVSRLSGGRVEEFMLEIGLGFREENV